MEEFAPPETPPARRPRAAAGLGIAGGVTLTYGSVLQFLVASPYAVGAYRVGLVIGVLLGIIALIGGLLLVLRPTWNLCAGVLLMAAGLGAFRGYSRGGPYAVGELLAIIGGVLALLQTRRFVSWAPARLPLFLAGHFLAGLVFLGGSVFMFYEGWSAWWSISTCYGGYSGPCITPFFLLFNGLAFLLTAAFFLAWGVGQEKGLVVLGIVMTAFGLAYPLWTEDYWICSRSVPAPFSMFCGGFFGWVFLAVGVAALVPGAILRLRRRRLTAGGASRRTP